MPIPTKKWIKPLFPEGAKDYHDYDMPSKVKPANWKKLPEAEQQKIDEAEAKAAEAAGAAKDKAGAAKAPPAEPAAFSQKSGDPTKTNNQAITEAEEAKAAGCPGSSADCTTNVMPIPTKKWIKPLFPEGAKDYHDYDMPSKVKPANWKKLPEAEQQKIDEAEAKAAEAAGAAKDKAGAAKAPPAEPAAFSQKRADPTKTSNQEITEA